MPRHRCYEFSHRCGATCSITSGTPVGWTAALTRSASILLTQHAVRAVAE